MPTRPRRRWFQFTTAAILLATFWVAVFCVALKLFMLLEMHELVPHESETGASLVIGCVLFISIPAAIGCLVSRWWIGALIGLGIFIAYVTYIMIAISIHGI